MALRDDVRFQSVAPSTLRVVGVHASTGPLAAQDGARTWWTVTREALRRPRHHWSRIVVGQRQWMADLRRRRRSSGGLGACSRSHGHRLDEARRTRSGDPAVHDRVHRYRADARDWLCSMTVVVETPQLRLYQGHVLEQLREIPAESVD